MPTLDEAYAALQRKLSAATIDLVVAAREPALVALASALALVRAGPAFTVTDAQLVPGRTEISLGGNAAVTLGGTGTSASSVSVRLTATEPIPGTVLFALALTVTASSWTFATSFPTLPQTLRAAADGATVEWGDSVLRGLRVDNATFTASSAAGARLRMTGALRSSGDFAQYSGWLGPWPLALEGPITLPAASTDPPVFDLRATVPEGALGAYPVILRKPGFRLIANPDESPDLDETDPANFSEIQAIGTLVITGATPIVAELSGTLLVSGRTWRMMADFGGNGPSLAGGLGQLAGLFGLSAGNLATPPALGGFETFALDGVEAWMTGTPATGPTGLLAIAATIRSDTTWNPPIPLLTVTDVGTRWALMWARIGSATPSAALAGSVFGSLVFSNGEGKKPGIVDVRALLPSFVLEGQQRDDTEINVSAAFRELFGRSAPAVPGDPAITDLWVYADPFERVFEGGATITGSFPLPFLTGVSIKELGFEVGVSQSAIAGGISGRLQFGAEATAAVLSLRAELPPPADSGSGWIFSGGLEPGKPLTLGALMRTVGIPVATGSDLEGLAIDKLAAAIDTGHSTWTFAGALGVRWSPSLLGTTIDLAAGVELELAKTAATAQAIGWIEGRFSVNRLAVMLRRDIGVAEPTYALRVQFGGLWALATTSTRGDPAHQVVTIQLGGVTLGDVLEEIVNLAAPTLGFRLDPPWDVLKRIELSRFRLVIDPTDRVVELTYAVDADLVIMRIDTVGVRYTMGGESAVDLILTGGFLGKEFKDTPGSKPLEWDVVNDPGPALPGHGPQLLELRYLGLGQRVRLEGPQPETVAEAIDRLRTDMPERKPGTTDPVAGTGMVFDASSQWLIGVDIRVLEIVQVSLIFNDPRLYGIAIALDGERAGPLAGLRFEILYKQIAPGLGMFRIELRIPEAFRHIELGEVSLTLGVIVVEVYTNGNFLIDLGFPHNRDYERAFTVQVFPFIGRGGIYFGVLNGATSRRVPAITNGTFSPVLELGVGLAVGVGKDIAAGPLSGGAYVELEVIFQGVLAWFHPAESSASTALYHWAQGIVAIHGKVFASVDFGVVKASVTLEAYAQATVVFESCRATRFALEVHVEAEAEIEILWVTTSFSFKVSMDLGFTVGSDVAPPWALAATQPPRVATGRQPRRLAAHQALRTRALAATSDPAGWTWPEQFSAFGAARTLDISMLPAFSVANATVSWTSVAPTPPAEPAWRVAFCLFAPNGVLPSALTAETAVASVSETAEPVAAASVVSALLGWSLAALPAGVSESGMVTAGELALLAEEMRKPYVAREQFTRDRLATLFSNNLQLRISGDTGDTTAAKGAMSFPALPWLQIAGTDLFTHNPVGPTYEAGLRAYMARYVPDTSTPGGPPSDLAPLDDPAAYQSFAARVFCDWCLMVAREAVRQASIAMQDTTVKPGATGDDPVTLDSTAETLPRDVVQYTVRPNDTVVRVAAWLGAGAAELEALNPKLASDLGATSPGDKLALTVGVAGCTLAVDNATVPLATGVTIAVKDVRVQVRAGDSLDAISKRLYAASDAAQLVTDAKLAADPRLLRTAAPFTVPQRQAPLSGQPSTALLAATMYVRYFADIAAPNADWYAQAVAGANERVIALGPDDAIPAGWLLAVPPSFGAAATGTYTTRIGDTLLTIGATLSLAQAPAAYARQAWQEFRAKVTADGGGTVPQTTVGVLPGESLDLLAARLALTGAGAAVVPWLKADPVLAPLATIQLATLSLSSDTHATLADMAATAGLTIDELGRRSEVTTAPDLFALETSLAVKHLPAQTITSLVAAVSSGKPLAEISHLMSRNALGGQRVLTPKKDPDPSGTVRAAPPLASALEIAGQQIAAPALSTTAKLEVTVGHSTPSQSWITFADAPGGATVDTLAFTYDGAALAARYPAASLTRKPRRGPQAIAVAGSVPRTYGLDHRIDLQSAVTLAVPGTDANRSAGMPSLWRFPSALIARARAPANTVGYDVLRSSAEGQSPEHHDVVVATTFATVVELAIRRVAGREHVYEMVGADTADRELLRELATYAHGESGPTPTRAYIAVAPVAGARVPNGLAVLRASPTATFLVRSNMATDVPLTAAPGVMSAGFGDVGDFLALLWDASVATSGYHLGFATSDGADLPAGAFSDDGSARLWLIVIPRDSQGAVTEGRPLLRTDNCAIVADGLDAAAHSLYVEAYGADLHPQELVKQAIVPAGSIGVTLTVDRALAPVATDPVRVRAAARTAQLFSLLVSRIDGGIYALDAGPPAPPQREDGLHLARWQRERELRAARLRRPRATSLTTTGRDAGPVAYWRFDDVVPIARYGPPSSAPAVPGLPAPANDPYRGFGAATALATATFHLSYADVLGNVTAPASDDEVDVSVGYTDPLLGPAAWPGATTSFGLALEAGVVTLTVHVASQPGTVIPASNDVPDRARDMASRQAARYAEAYYQLSQPSLSGSLLTTLYQDATGKPVEVALSEGVAPLWRFAAAAHLYAAAAAAMSPAPVTGLGTLSAVSARYGVGLDALGSANADRGFGDLATSGQAVSVTARIAVSEGDDAAAVLARVPAGWPKPASASLLLQTAPNPDLALRAGTVVEIKPVTIVLGAGAKTETLDAVAGEHHTTPAQLVIDNAAAPLLRTGFSFAAGGQTVAVDGDAIKSFSDVRTRFSKLAVDVSDAELANAAAAATGLFADAASITFRRAVAKAEDTLTTLAAGELKDLADRNAATADLFASGRMLALGDTWTPALEVPADALDTLARFAELHGATPARVLAANPSLTLAAGSDLAVPGTTVVPETVPVVPYTLVAGDTLATLRTLFGQTPADTATGNQEMPGLLAVGASISVVVAGTAVAETVVAGDTLATVTARLHAKSPTIDLPAVASAIQDTATVLVTGALVVMPMPKLAVRAATQPAALTPAMVVASYGVDALAFGQANAALVGVLASGVKLAAPGTTKTWTTAPADTLNAVLARAASEGVEVDLAGLLETNAAVGMFAAQARALLPPVAVAVTAPIGAGSGTSHDPVFPLSVTLRLKRDSRVVLISTSGGDGPVERADSRIPAPSAPGAKDGASRTFAAFMKQFEAALPDLRLGTARVEGVAADLWVVDLTARGLGSVTVKAPVAYPDGTKHPRFLALRPLYPALQSRTGVPVPELDLDGAETAAFTLTDFQGQDVEVWARRLLEDVDLFTSAPYAAAIHANAASSGALDTLLAAKWKLAGAVAAGLAPVLVTTDGEAATATAAAVAELSRACGAGLLAAYDVSTVIQYDTTADSAYTDSARHLRPARLVGAAEPVAPLVATGTPLPARELSLARAATALDAPAGFAGFAMTIPDPEHHATIATGPLRYAFDTVQFDIQPAGADGYVASNQGSLLRPLTGHGQRIVCDLGSPTVPAPLRTHPAVPLVLEQTARPTHDGDSPPTLEQAALWTYGLTYSHEHAEQDEILLSVTFNVDSETTRAVAGAPLGVAQALGIYASLAGRLRELMSWYVDPPAQRPANLQAVLDTVAGTVAKLTGDAATAWAAHWKAVSRIEAPGPQRDLATGSQYHFRIAASYSTITSGAIDKIALTLEDTALPGPEGTWPVVLLAGSDGVFVQLTGTASGTTSVYRADEPIAVGGWPTIRLEWPDLNVAAVGNALGSLQARRNEHLLGGVKPVATNAAFVLSSATVTAVDIATPLLEWSIDQPIGGAADSVTFASALATALGEALRRGDKAEALDRPRLRPPSRRARPERARLGHHERAARGALPGSAAVRGHDRPGRRDGCRGLARGPEAGHRRRGMDRVVELVDLARGLEEPAAARAGAAWLLALVA